MKKLSHLCFTILVFLTLVESKQTFNQQCSEGCKTESFTGCKICYRQCQSQSQASEQNSFEFVSCKLTKCQHQKFKDNSSNCLVSVNETLIQRHCIRKCCPFSQFQTQNPTFTSENLKECFQKTFQHTIQLDQLEFADTINGVIVFGLTVVILLAIFCLFSNRKSLSLLGKRINNKYFPKRKTGRQFKNQFNDNVNQLKKLKWEQKEPIDVSIDDGSFSSKQSVSIHTVKKKVKCCFCREPQTNCQTACGHDFHIFCLFWSVNQTGFCPKCKSSKFNNIRIFCQSCPKEAIYHLSSNPPALYTILNKRKINCPQCVLNSLRA